MNYNKRILTYEEYGKMMDRFVLELKKVDIKFDWVFGLPRGAWPMVTHLSHHLKLEVYMSCYSLDEFPNYSCPRKNVLVIDDICHTGRTFEIIKEFDDGHHCFYASLFYRKDSTFKPDLYLEETEDWIVFPWECYDEEPNR